MLKINEVTATKENAIMIMEDESMYVIIRLNLFDHCIMKQAKDCTLGDILSEDNKVVQIVKVEA
jgi:hypothetical protein